MRFLLKLSILLFVSRGVSQEVKGITYHNTSPLPDVNISVKNSSERTISDRKGKFALKATIGDTLIFSYIGMHTEERRIEYLDSLKIHLMKKITVLEEVEVKSKRSKMLKPKSLKSIFGEIEVDKLGYAAYPFSGEEIQSYSSIGIAEALIGRVPNYQLTPEGVVLRSSRNNLALWDIDGMLFDGLPPFLDPESIESVLVIPSGAGTIRYGKRGSGGVIIVNTNRFKSREKPKIPLKQLNHLSLDEIELPVDDRKLSEIVKKSANDLEKLRLMAWAYKKQGNSALALRLNRLLFSYCPDDINSYRDLAESLLSNNQKKEAWNTYLIYLDKYGERVDKALLGIIINDMERLYHSFNLKKTIGKKFDSKINPKMNSDETRIVFEWTTANENLSVEVINPNDQSIQFQLGNNATKTYSIQELFLDGNIKGTWKMNLSVLEDIEQDGTLKVTVYHNWSSSKEPPQSNIFLLSDAVKNKYTLMEIKL